MNDHSMAVRDFHRAFYNENSSPDGRQGLHALTRYHGIETHKCPLDLWVFQEILHDVRPALVTELGTFLGGTTLFLAHQMDLFNCGNVVSVDCRELSRPQHPRVQYFVGNTQSPEIIGTIRLRAQQVTGPVLVIHDAAHHYDVCLEDLETYGPLVTAGSYLIVEDTNVNGHPVNTEWGPGPWEAVETFLVKHSEFARDPGREKFLMTYNLGGYLRRAPQ